jgi:hypothetical protein
MWGDWIDRLAAGSKYTGIGLIAYTMYRLLVFGCTFVAARLDAREGRLNAQEERVDASLAKRLGHLERQDHVNRRAIVRLERMVRILATELFRLEPDNPKLADVAASLHHVWVPDHDTPDDMNDTLGKLP